MASREPAEPHQAEIADLLSDCATLSLAMYRERARLAARLQWLSARVRDLESAVADLRDAAARHRPVEGELDELRRLRTSLRGELSDRRGRSPARPRVGAMTAASGRQSRR